MWVTYTYCATCDRAVSNAATECRHCGARFGTIRRVSDIDNEENS
jgi:hypothetical protein